MNDCIVAFEPNLRSEFLKHPALVKAYCNTAYRVHAADVVWAIQIGQVCPLSDQIIQSKKPGLAQPGLACIGAENPGNQSLPEAENTRRHQKFKENLQARGLFLAEGVGQGETSTAGQPAHHERFCLVGPMELKNAVALSEQEGQVGFVWVPFQGVAQLVITGRVK